jgi:hypothetical protein
MIDKTSPPYGEHCRQFVWHVHVLRMFTEREQDELVNNILTSPGGKLFGNCQSISGWSQQVINSLTKS